MASAKCEQTESSAKRHVRELIDLRATYLTFDGSIKSQVALSDKAGRAIFGLDVNTGLVTDAIDPSLKRTGAVNGMFMGVVPMARTL